MLHCFLLKSQRPEKAAVFPFCTLANENRNKLGRKLRYELLKCYITADKRKLTHQISLITAPRNSNSEGSTLTLIKTHITGTVVVLTEESLRKKEKKINKIHAVALQILITLLCLSLWQKTTDNLNNNLSWFNLASN